MKISLEQVAEVLQSMHNEARLIIKKKSKTCKHSNAYYFHDNAPQYCPDCKQYIDGGKPIN